MAAANMAEAKGDQGSEKRVGGKECFVLKNRKDLHMFKYL